jgi:iron(III) transport system substrate-binding protein
MRISALLLGICAALLAVRAASVAAPIETACQAGRGEPPMIWYSSQDPARNEAAMSAFALQYPEIKVEGFRLVTGQLAARYASERAAGVVNADLISLADPIFINKGLDSKWFIEFDKAELPALAKLDDRWFHRGAATTSISMLGIAYNKDRVGNNPPKTWNDLLRPEFKDKIVLGDPRSVPSYLALARIWRDALGDDFLKALAAQNPVIVPSVVPSTQQLAAGEVAIVVPNVMTVVRPLKLDGAPIDFVAPALTTGNEFVSVLSAGAHSPNAARCFFNFLFTEKGQIAYNGPTSVSPFGAIGGGEPLPSAYIDPKINEVAQHQKELLTLMGLQ